MDCGFSSAQRAILLGLILMAALAGCDSGQTMAAYPTATMRPVPTAALPTPTPTAVTPTPAAPTATLARPTPTLTPVARRAGGPPVRLVIPSIDLDQAIVPVGLDADRMPIVPKHDVGWYNRSAMPGQGENVVLWGHVLRFRDAPHIPAPFARLKEAPVGALLFLYDANGTRYVYEITKHIQVTPDQVEYVLPKGYELVTMVSCIGEKVIVNGSVDMTHRLITIARPVAD